MAQVKIDCCLRIERRKFAAYAVAPIKFYRDKPFLYLLRKSQSCE